MFKKLFKNQLVKGSFILFIGNMFCNVANYLYHLLMGRMLGPDGYAVLAALISLTYILAIPNATLNLVVVRYVSSFLGKGESDKITPFYNWLNKKIVAAIFFGLILLLILSPKIAHFLHIESAFLVLLMAVSGLIGFYVANNLAVLQGFLRFGSISVLSVISTGIKLFLSIGLVLLGMEVFGAILSFFVVTLVGLLLSAVLINRLLVKDGREEVAVDGKAVLVYAWPVFLSTLCFTSLFTTDILLAKHFLSAQWAGYYASLAILGKIIFFASGPIVQVMFPLVANYSEKGRDHKKILNLSLLLVFLASLGITGIYFILPELMVKILYGSSYLPAAKFLPLFAVFLSFYALSSLLVNFYLSIKKTNVVFLPAVAALAQILLIFLFHQNLTQIVTASVIVLGLLFLSLLMYHFTNGSQKRAIISNNSCLSTR